VNKKTIDEFIDKNARWIEKRKNSILMRYKDFKE